jgi:hypothetical protein
MIIGLAGTAKNTGKTTALGTLIHTAYAKGQLPGVTGIGYDGEERDNVTLLPKPRITVFPGMLVSTSEKCLKVSTAGLRIVQRTGVMTALGEVVIASVVSEGLVVVAGPNKSSDLRKISHQMLTLGSSNLFVDGSLNRIAPMTVADQVVFATGGARSTNIQFLAEELSAIETIFRSAESTEDYKGIAGIRLEGKDIQIQCCASLFHGIDEIAGALRSIPEELTCIVFPGMLTADGLAFIARRLKQVRVEGVTLVFDNPFRLLLAGEPATVAQTLKTMGSRAIRICYRRITTLAAFTFNPYYPAFDGTTYRPAYLEASSGRATLAGTLSSPVIDVRADGESALYDTCFLGS